MCQGTLEGLWDHCESCQVCKVASLLTEALSACRSFSACGLAGCGLAGAGALTPQIPQSPYYICASLHYPIVHTYAHYPAHADLGMCPVRIGGCVPKLPRTPLRRSSQNAPSETIRKAL